MTDAPNTMRAAVFHGRGDIRIEDRPVPVPRDGELLLRVGAVGVCGTDASEWAHGPHLFPVEVRHPASGHLGPLIPGHEFSGTVVGLGAGVAEHWADATVASCGSICCGVCAWCLGGRSNLCRRYRAVGLHQDGALAEYVVTPTENCMAVDRYGLSLDEAALAQPMAIAVHNARRAGDVAGRRVLVQGVGGIGAFLVAVLAAAGARVLATDVAADRLAIARAMGADRVLQVGGSDDTAAVAAAADGDELEVVFEVSGTGAGLATALALAPVGGRIVAVGIQKAPREIDMAALTLREQTLLGTNALVRETDFPHAVELVAARRGEWQLIAPTAHPLADLVDHALAPLAAGHPGAIKTLIDPRAAAARPACVPDPSPEPPQPVSR